MIQQLVASHPKVHMQSSLDRRCQDVLHAASLNEYTKLVQQFAHELGMRTFGSTVITDHSPTLTEFQYITNAAADYRADYEDLELAKIDPVSQHGKHFSTPLIWDLSTYIKADRGPLWEHQALFGYRSGVSVALHLPRGRHFLFGFDSDYSICCNSKDARRLAEDVHVYAAHAQAAAFDLCTPYQPRSENEFGLTRLELEPLRWSMDGLNNWEVGNKLGLSDRDVARRLKRASKVLGCGTTYETVLRAIKLGLIRCP